MSHIDMAINQSLLVASLFSYKDCRAWGSHNSSCSYYECILRQKIGHHEVGEKIGVILVESGYIHLWKTTSDEVMDISREACETYETHMVLSVGRQIQ